MGPLNGVEAVVNESGIDLVVNETGGLVEHNAGVRPVVNEAGMRN
jgi:hypothetical protein